MVSENKSENNPRSQSGNCTVLPHYFFSESQLPLKMSYFDRPIKMHVHSFIGKVISNTFPQNNQSKGQQLY